MKTLTLLTTALFLAAGAASAQCSWSSAKQTMAQGELPPLPTEGERQAES